MIGYFHVYLPLHFHGPVDIYWLINIYGFLNNDWLFIDWLVHVYLLLYHLGNPNLLYNDLRNLFFYFDILGDFHYFLNNSLRASDVLRHFHFNLIGLFDHNFSDGFFGSSIGGFLFILF